MPDRILVLAEHTEALTEVEKQNRRVFNECRLLVHFDRLLELLDAVVALAFVQQLLRFAFVGELWRKSSLPRPANLRPLVCLGGTRT